MARPQPRFARLLVTRLVLSILSKSPLAVSPCSHPCLAESTLHLVLRLRGGGHKSNPWKKAHSKMRWKWKKKRTRRLQRKRRKMRQRSK